MYFSGCLLKFKIIQLTHLEQSRGHVHSLLVIRFLNILWFGLR